MLRYINELCKSLGVPEYTSCICDDKESGKSSETSNQEKQDKCCSCCETQCSSEDVNSISKGTNARLECCKMVEKGECLRLMNIS